MSPEEFDIQLSLAIGDEVSVPYTDGAVFTAASRQAATLRACREYSKYRPALRRYGTGYTFGQANGTSFLMAGGGDFKAGATINVGVASSQSESVVISNVNRYTSSTGSPPVPNAINMNNLIEVTLVAPGLQNVHPDGTYVSLPTPGLTVVGGQDTYQLPYDWIAPEQSSFDLTTGNKMVWKETNGYYDATYFLAMQLTGLGLGYSATYGVGSPYGYAIAGDPFNNPNGIPGDPQGGVIPAPGYRFYNGDEPKLVVYPTPSPTPESPVSSRLIFDYYASHTVSTIPTNDEEPVLSYAIYSAVSSKTIGMGVGSNFDRKIAQVEYMPSHQMKELRAIAKEAKNDFDIKIRLVPYCTSG